MTRPRPLYVDDDGVQRGYYVYLHRCKQTDTVFYVGKGHANRAWETTRRSTYWRDRVAALPSGWRVELARDDLSESEAFALEKELVETHGGSGSSGGSLANWIPGGENPVSTEISIELDDSGSYADYCKSREFKQLTRTEQESFARELSNRLSIVSDKLSDLEDEAMEQEIESLEGSVIEVKFDVNTVMDAGADLLRRRMSWQHYALTLEETVEVLKSDLRELEDVHERVRPLLKEVAQICMESFSTINGDDPLPQ